MTQKKGRGPYILYSVVVLQQHISFYQNHYHTCSGSSLASSQSFPLSNRMSPPYTYYISFEYIFLFVLSSLSLPLKDMFLKFWKARFRKCLLNNRKSARKYQEISIVCPPKGFQLPVYFPKLCVKMNLTVFNLIQV